MRFCDRVAVVTGGSAGIGSAERKPDRTLAVDLLTCRAVVPIMRRQRSGHIVNSVAGRHVSLDGGLL